MNTWTKGYFYIKINVEVSHSRSQYISGFKLPTIIHGSCSLNLNSEWIKDQGLGERRGVLCSPSR